MAVRTIRNGTIVIKDSGGVNSATATFDGELSWTATKSPIPMSDRGTLGHFRPGNQACVEVSFNILCQGLTGGPSIYDALTRTGGATGWISVTSTTDDVYTIAIEVTYADPVTSVGDNEKITFAKCALTRIEFAEAEEGNRLTFTLVDLEETPTIAAA